MTKINSRRKKISMIVAASLALEMIAPFAVFAAPAASNASNFCSRIDTLMAAAETSLASRTAKLDEERNRHDGDLVTGRKNHDNDLASARAEQDARKTDFYSKLNAKADTDAKKQAVADFKKSMDAAITARRSAVDAAIAAFRAAVDDAIAKRKTGIDSAVATLKAALDAAFNKAKNDCGSGVKPATIRISLRAAVKSARIAFAADRKKVERIGANISQSAATRRIAVAKALADFKAAAEKARKSLKAALGK